MRRHTAHVDFPKQRRNPQRNRVKLPPRDRQHPRRAFAGAGNKKARCVTSGLFARGGTLFQLRLFVFHVFTCDRVELLDDEFLAHRFFVLSRRVEVTGACGGLEFDFFTHDCRLPRLDRASGAHIGENGVDAFLVDQTNACGGESDADEAVFAFNPETTALQIREESAFGFVVSVRNIVSHHRLFAGDLTYASHEGTPVTSTFRRRTHFALARIVDSARLYRSKDLRAANVKETACTQTFKTAFDCSVKSNT
jgi:hypothetical protein